MLEWTETTVGGFCPFAYGKGLPQQMRNSGGTIPVVGSNGLVGYHDSSLTHGPTVIVGRKGTVGAAHYCPVPCWPIDTTFWISEPDHIALRFKYYLLKSLGLEYMNADSAVPGLNREAAHACRIMVPPLPEQRAIAHILGTLDDKIALNRRMNQTLEAMAQALFKSWFVDFEPFRDQGMQDSPLGRIPMGWRVGRLDQIASFTKGVSYRSEDLRESDTALVTLKSVTRGGGYQHEGLKPYVGEYEPAQQVQPGEVVVAHTDLTQKAEVLGQAARVQAHPKVRTMVASLDLVVVRPTGEEASNEYLYGLLSTDEFQEHAYSYANGTTVLHLSAKALPQYQCVLPPSNVVNDFTELVRPICRLFDSNEVQNGTLVSIRDALLPKLLSGEVRVKDAEKFVEKAA